MHGKGLLPSDPKRTAHRLGADLHPAIDRSLTAGIRGSGDLSPKCPPMFDQSRTGTCAEHSFIAGVCTVLALSWIPSMLALASCTYGLMRAKALPVGATNLPPLGDNGSQLQDVADAGSEWGLAPMTAPIGGRVSDVPDDVPGVPFPEPDPAAIVIAGKELIRGEYAIAVDANAPTTVAASIDAGIPVWVGTYVDGAFEALQPGQIARPANPSDPNGGGHALLIVGYRTNAAGALEFKVRNSWGPGWCEEGYCWASTAWLMACWDLWPVAVAS